MMNRLDTKKKQFQNASQMLNQAVLHFGKSTWRDVNTAEVVIFSGISDERYRLFVTGSCREYRQGNLCNLFTRS